MRGKYLKAKYKFMPSCLVNLTDEGIGGGKKLGVWAKHF